MILGARPQTPDKPVNGLRHAQTPPKTPLTTPSTTTSYTTQTQSNTPKNSCYSVIGDDLPQRHIRYERLFLSTMKWRPTTNTTKTSVIFRSVASQCQGMSNVCWVTANMTSERRTTSSVPVNDSSTHIVLIWTPTSASNHTRKVPQSNSVYEPMTIRPPLSASRIGSLNELNP